MAEPAVKFHLTDAAAVVVKGLLEKPGQPPRMLRIAAKPGGCKGFSYELWTDDHSRDGDVVLEFQGARVLLDAESEKNLRGAVMDFAERGEERGFTIENPNPSGGCSCTCGKREASEAGGC